YFDKFIEGGAVASSRAAKFPTADMLLTSAQAKFVRKIFYTTAIPACAFFIGVVIGQQPYSVTSSRSLANTTVDVAALEATIDPRDLPRQNVSLEVYQ